MIAWNEKAVAEMKLDKNKEHCNFFIMCIFSNLKIKEANFRKYNNCLFFGGMHNYRLCHSNFSFLIFLLCPKIRFLNERIKYM